MLRPVSLVAILVLAGCGHPPSVADQTQPLVATPGMISGVVRERRSQTPLVSAQVTVDGSPVAARTNQLGRFVLGPLPPGAHTLRVAYIGFLPGVVDVVVADTGSVSVDVALRYPGDGPPVAAPLVLPIWEVVLAHYQPAEAAHVRTTTSTTGTPADPSNTAQLRVMLLDTAHATSQSVFSSLYHALVAEEFALGVCRSASATECPDTAFTTYIGLGVPHQDSADTVAVAVDETAINPRYCRRGARGTSFGGSSSSVLYVGRIDGKWQVIGEALRMSGTVVCGHE